MITQHDVTRKGPVLNEADTQLIAAFLDATANLSTYRAAEESGVSEATIRRFREQMPNRLYTDTRLALQAYLSRAGGGSGNGNGAHADREERPEDAVFEGYDDDTFTGGHQREDEAALEEQLRQFERMIRQVGGNQQMSPIERRRRQIDAIRAMIAVYSAIGNPTGFLYELLDRAERDEL